MKDAEEKVRALRRDLQDCLERLVELKDAAPIPFDTRRLAVAATQLETAILWFDHAGE